MAQDVIRADRNYTGAIDFSGTVNLPPAVITDQNVLTGADISADKVIHRHSVGYAQDNGADVAAKTSLIHVARKAGTIISVEVRPSAVPTGGDKAAQIDVQKAADASGSWTSIITATIDFTQASAAHTLKVGTLAGPATYADGDAFRVVVTVSGTTGTQMQGFHVTVNLDELPV